MINSVISPEQSAFVSKRNIVDDPLYRERNNLMGQEMSSEVLLFSRLILKKPLIMLEYVKPQD